MGENKEEKEDFQPANIIDIPQNTVDGACDDLYNRTREKGVFNEFNGTYHKNNDNEHPQVGVTAYQISFNPSQPISEKTERNVQKYKCINNERCLHSNQIYDSRSKCEEECPSGGLGCFTGRCEGMTWKAFITSKKIKIDFKLVTVKSYGLKWKPSQAISQQCKDAIQKYEKDLSIHEGKHIQDLKDIVKQANDKWTDKPY